MYVYQIDADAAFELLKWRSQAANVKLRALAVQLLADVQSAIPLVEGRSRLRTICSRREECWTR